MTRKTIVFMLLALVCFRTESICQNYAVSEIGPELLENACAVIRNDQTHCTVEEGNSIHVERVLAITILSEAGDFLNDFVEYYDSYRSIGKVRLNLYDKWGKKQETVRQKDFTDRSAVSGYSLFEDTRLLIYNPVQGNYPYTVEYTWDYSEKEVLFLPSWFPVSNEKVSLEKSSYTLDVPRGYEVSYKFLNTGKTFERSSDESRDTYQIHLADLPAVEYEPYSPGWQDLFVYGRIVPMHFNREGYPGSNASWSEFGKWKHSLREDRMDLPEAAIREVSELIQDIESPEGKIKAIYAYLQNSTRYVNISYGLGGFQPYPAATVHKNKYGDCKALTNYMQALLQVAGIESYYTSVYAGTSPRKVMIDMPHQQFNHVFLCVPLEGDTIWLECTTQHSPPGFLGRFTDDRTVLLSDDNGGKIARTRRYTTDENLQHRVAILEFDSLLTRASADIRTVYEGQQYTIIDRMLQLPEDEQRKQLLNSIDIPHFSIAAFGLENQFRGFEPVGSLALELEIRDPCSSSGNSSLLPLNLMNKYSRTPKASEDRTQDLYIGFGFHDVDSIVYKIPGHFNIAYIPENLSLKESFGEFSFSCFREGNNLVAVYDLRFHKGRYPAERYADFVEFYRNIVKASRFKALLVPAG